MTRLRAANFLRLATIVAMVVQLGVAAFHHHDVITGHDLAHAGAEHAHHHTADHSHHHHGHDDHDLGTHHHDDPVHDDGHACDLCLLKTAVASTLIPHATGALDVPRALAKLHFANKDVHRHDAFFARYLARAPPAAETLIS